MPDDRIREYRERVRNILGTAVAEKASDAFCAAFAQRQDTFEAMHAPSGAVAPVVELAPEPPPPVPLRVAVEGLRKSAGWQDALKATRDLLRTSLDPRSAQRVNALLNPVALLREAYVKDLRERCHRSAAPFRDELGRAAARLHALTPELEETSGAHTEYCWLNQTVRTRIDPLGLRELAADSAIMHIDVARELELETSESGRVVGATAHRENTGYSGKGVVVAVIDREVERSHPAFDGRVFNMGNFSHEDWGEPHPHGTQVAGIIAARHHEFSGMAPDAVIYSYKVKPRFSDNDFFAACALQQALEDGAHIANCSWGIPDMRTDGTSRLVRACDQAWACGMTIVKSAGNRGPGSHTVTCPADAQGIIVVGATNRKGSDVLRSSSRGPALNCKVCPDMVAPGGDSSDDITTCALGGKFGPSEEGLTSLAAAHVTGLLCLLLEEEPDLTPDEQRERLFTMCKRLPPTDEGEYAQGKGLVSLANLPS